MYWYIKNFEEVLYNSPIYYFIYYLKTTSLVLKTKYQKFVRVITKKLIYKINLLWWDLFINQIYIYAVSLHIPIF